MSVTAIRPSDATEASARDGHPATPSEGHPTWCVLTDPFDPCRVHRSASTYVHATLDRDQPLRFGGDTSKVAVAQAQYAGPHGHAERGIVVETMQPVRCGEQWATANLTLSEARRLRDELAKAIEIAEAGR